MEILKVGIQNMGYLIERKGLGALDGNSGHIDPLLPAQTDPLFSGVN
jgi:hypothetical protein